MKKDELIKRGLIIGLAISTLIVPLPTTMIAKADTAGIAHYELSDGNAYEYSGSTGYNTSISIMNKKDYEIAAPDKVINEVNIPMNYINPWYVKGSSDGAKAIKGYYYLGTVIYNDTVTTGGKNTGSGYASLSDDEKENYKDLKIYYTDQLTNYKNAGKSTALAKENAEKDLLKKGIHFQSKELPLIFELITGDKFNYDYWYEKGISDIEQFEGYSSSTSGSSTVTTKISQGTKSNFALKVMATSGDNKIVQTFSAVVNGEARVYAKGLAKGTTTVTVKVVTNNDEKYSYKIKVVVASEGTPIKYKEGVNPLSYEGYCIGHDGVAWLSYITENGDFFSTTSDNIMRSSVCNIYKDSHYDKSTYMKDYLQSIGAYELLEAGSSEYDVYCMVMDAINSDRMKSEGEGLYSGDGDLIYWCSLQQYLEDGCGINCSGRSNIMSGVADCLGLNWFNVTSTDHIEPYIVLDGEIYFNNANPLVGVYKLDNSICAGEVSNCVTSEINYVSLSDIANQKYKNKFNSFLYKVQDKYTAGGFAMGSGDYIDIDELGLLQNELGDNRVITVITDYDASESPFWNNNSNYAVSLQYSVPYVQKAYFSKISKGSTKQIQLVNSEWNDWVVKSGNSSIVTVSAVGKFTMKGTGTAMITLSSKSIKGLAIKVIVSTEKLNSSTTASKTGTYYNGDTVLAGDYVRK